MYVIVIEGFSYHKDLHDIYNQMSILQFYIKMNFQTNKLQSVTSMDEFYGSLPQSIRIKTCQSDTLAGENTHKRFQRSQSKKTSQNFSLGQSKQRDRILTTVQQDKKRGQETGFGVPKSAIRQINLFQSQISTQKFIPNTMKQFEQFQSFKPDNIKNQLKIGSSKEDKLESSRKLKTLQNLSVSNKQVYPFKSITLTSTNQLPIYPNYSQNFFSKQETVQKQCPKTVTNAKTMQKLRVLFSKSKPETPIEKANSSTQCSIVSSKIEKKILKCHFGSQTENKREISTAVNTIQPKTCSLKIQTEADWALIQKSNLELKAKVVTMEEENKKIRLELINVKKERQNLKKMLGEKQNNERIHKSTTCYQKSSHNLLNQRHQNEGFSTRQISLQESIVALRKQIQFLKQGSGIRKVQQVLEIMKRQNIALINQIQAISLKCRVLEQQNNQLGSFQQQSRKLKTQIKYFRGSIKDHQMQIERLKLENKKLRSQFKCKANFYDNSRVLSGWGSQTDSLNLSVSIIRD